MLADGHWFDADAAQSWHSGDLSPDDPVMWTWEILWRTKSGRYVVDERHGGLGGGMEDLSEATLKNRDFTDERGAASWFVRHGLDLPEELLTEDFKKLEI